MRVGHESGLVMFEVADDSALALAIRKRDLIEAAAADLAAYPQYANYHDGDEWVLVHILRDVRTKMGLAFTRHEIALGKHVPADDDPDGMEHWHVWSPSNKIHTHVPPKWAEAV